MKLPRVPAVKSTGRTYGAEFMAALGSWAGAPFLRSKGGVYFFTWNVDHQRQMAQNRY